MLQLSEILKESNISRIREHLNNYIIVLEFNTKRGIRDDALKSEYQVLYDYYIEIGGDGYEFTR